MLIAEKAPRLEAVTLDGINVPVKSMFEFCKLSKSLHRLAYSNVSIPGVLDLYLVVVISIGKGDKGQNYPGEIQ